MSNLFAGVSLTNLWDVNVELLRRHRSLSTTELRGGPALVVPARNGWWVRVLSDRRRTLSGDVMSNGYVEDDGGSSLTVAPALTLRPSSRAELSLRPALTRVVNPAQYVDDATAAGRTSYYVGQLRQTTASLTARASYTFTPSLSLQYYAQPFLSSGHYRQLRELRSPRAPAFDARFRTLGSPELARTLDGSFAIDRNGDGVADVTIDDPSFDTRELRSNAVLRWEYAPGSSIFVVWSQGRESDAERGEFDLAREGRALWRTPPTNVLLVKASYWFNR
jgi:hypothetical protein